MYMSDDDRQINYRWPYFLNFYSIFPDLSKYLQLKMSGNPIYMKNYYNKSFKHN